MNIIKLLNKICAVNFSEPCSDDLKRLTDENYRLVGLVIEINEVLTCPSYNSDEKMCEIKLLIDEASK